MTDEKSQIGTYRVMNPVVMMYPDLITPRGFGKRGQERGAPKYGAQFVFPSDHPELAELKKLMAAVAKARFPGASLSDLTFPIRDGNKMIANAVAKATREGTPDPSKKLEWAKGKAIIAARSKFPPMLTVKANGKFVDLTSPDLLQANKDAFYPGVKVLVEFNFQAGPRTKEEEKDWVTAYLQGVISLNTGERLASSGGAPMSERFSGYLGTSSEVDPFGPGAGSDDIPF